MRGTQEMGGMLYSGECRQTFREIPSIIPGNVLKHSVECLETVWGMSSNIPENVGIHSRECPQTFGGMLLMLGVNEENYWAESHLEPCQTSTMELFRENSKQP